MIADGCNRATAGGGCYYWDAVSAGDGAWYGCADFDGGVYSDYGGECATFF